MKDMFDFIKGFDLHTIIVVGIAFWFLNSSIGGRIDKLETRLDKLEKDIVAIKTTLMIHNMYPHQLANAKDDLNFGQGP